MERDAYSKLVERDEPTSSSAASDQASVLNWQPPLGVPFQVALTCPALTLVSKPTTLTRSVWNHDVHVSGSKWSWPDVVDMFYRAEACCNNNPVFFVDTKRATLLVYDDGATVRSASHSAHTYWFPANEVKLEFRLEDFQEPSLVVRRIKHEWV